MRLRRLWPAIAILASAAHAQETISLSQGMLITKSATVKKDSKLTLSPGPAGDCVTIKGNDITVDFNQAFVRAQKDVWHSRENFNGTGLLIDGCKNVTIRNLNVQGFAFNVRVINSENVRIENCDVSFSRSIRMLVNGQPKDTFLNLRDNNAWRAYGAGIWLEGSNGCSIERVYGTGGTIGVAVVKSNGNTIHNCDFSFGGGWGVALSQSSENVVSWNHLDFINRTWGGGWGGDSAALAVADSSNHNFFVGNSLTHSGDGFFLSNRSDIGPVNKDGFYDPQGASSNNVVALNDGSWSTANAFEGTFSDGNVYLNNQANSSNFGFWLGFSTNSLLGGNTVSRNLNDGIAIEQGRGTKIVNNLFERNGGCAIRLWATSQRERQPFPSTAIDILNNTIADGRAYFLDGSTDVAESGNKLVRTTANNFGFAQRPITNSMAAFQSSADGQKLDSIIKRKPADFQFYAASRMPHGTQWLRPADYAPDDFRGDLAAVRQADPGMIELYLIQEGVKIKGPDTADFEDTPDDPRYVRIVPKASDGDSEEREITVTLVSKDGKQTQRVSGTLRSSMWNLKWYAWPSLTYSETSRWNDLFASNPLKKETSRTLGGDWSNRSPSEGVPADHFALVATTRVTVPPGRYLFSSLSDDGIRVYVDERIVINRWDHHGATADNVAVSLDQGPHNIRVEYCQEDGGAVLKLDWKKV